MAAGMRVRLKALGCRLNEAELEGWAERFQHRGFSIAGDDDPADLIVVNTCAVTQEAVRKSRKLLRRSQRANPHARIVVSGCLAALDGEALARESGIDLVVGNRDKDRLVEIAVDALELPVMPELSTTELANPLFARGRQRAFVKVQDGCRYQCSFCVTTRARGDERSRPVAEVVGAVNRLARTGVQEVVLAGVHLGGYGSDLGDDPGTGEDLTSLLGAILADTDMPRVRLGSLEPWDLPESFWRLFENARLMPHLHLPLQSGSDRVLRRMARRCKTSEFAELAAFGRAAVPDLNITTDIIVGFPGETEDDWRRTLAFADAIGFGHVHIFAYSRRPGTRAADMPGQVDAETKKRRSRELHALAGRLKRQVLTAQPGKRVSVLCEGPPNGERAGHLFGYTPNYLPLYLESDGSPAAGNRILGVEVTGLEPAGDALVGRPL